MDVSIEEYRALMFAKYKKPGRMTQYDIYRRDGQIDGDNWKEIDYWVEPVMPDELKMTKVYFKKLYRAKRPSK